MPKLLLKRFVLPNYKLCHSFFFFLYHLLLLKHLLFENLSSLLSYDVSLTYSFFSLFFFNSLLFTIPGLLFHHLPHSQCSILSLKLHSSSLILFGILCATLIVLSSNFMTSIYDFKFYDSNLCLQYPSLRPFPPAHIYISLCLLDIIN